MAVQQTLNSVILQRLESESVWERGWKEKEGDKVKVWAGHRLSKVG